MEEATLQVQGVSCAHCVKSIEGSIGRLAGVQSVQVNLSESIVVVDFDPNKIGLEKIINKIEEQGYAVIE